MKAVNSSMGPLEWFLLIALSVLWGGSFFFVEVAVGLGLAAIDGRPLACLRCKLARSE